MRAELDNARGNQQEIARIWYAPAKRSLAVHAVGVAALRTVRRRM